MALDLELYRRQIRVTTAPPVRLSAVDISPEHPKHTLVFLHGYGGQSTQWKYQLHHFSFENRVVALDLRGHGRSDKPEQGYGMAEQLNDLECAFLALHLTIPFVLVGHSFGGAIATEYALKHPEQIEQLFLIATAGEFRLNPIYRLLLKIPVPVLRAAAPLTAGWLAAPPPVMVNWYRHNLRSWVGWNKFSKITVPTTVLRGQFDLVFARPLFDQVSKSIPNAEDIDVGASGHLVMLERREAVNRAIQRRLEQSTSTWRGETPASPTQKRTELLKQRPWLPHYDDGVPETIAVPQVPVHHLLRSAANRFPAKTALIFEGNRITYRRLSLEVNRFANALRSIGVDKGSRVMLLLPNLPQLVISFYGVLEAGGTVIFTLPTTDPQEIIKQVRESGTQILVTLTQFDHLIEQIKAEFDRAGSSPLKHIIFTHVADYLPLFKQMALHANRREHEMHLLDIQLDASMHKFTQLLVSHSRHSPEITVTPEDLAVIIYTGGTTAAPKGVMLSHRNLVANAIQTRHWMPDAKEGQERFLCAVPISHSYGLTAALNVPIALGAALILKGRFETEDVLRTIRKYKPTIFPGVPAMYLAIKDFRAARKYGVQSVKACISGSAPLPVEVQEAFEKLTKGRLVEGYGLTEASPVTHANPLTGQRRVGSIGIPLPSTEARIVDLRKGHHPVPDGQIGELAIRGPQVMMGYWNHPQETARAITRDGWLLTGDVAQRDLEGYFRIVARKADMWYPEKPDKPAFPRDVEEVLFEVPQVKEAAVVAIANQPVAFVIAQKDKPSAEALIAYCKRRLPPEIVPKLVLFVDDFPRTFIGKVLRRELARRFEQGQLERK